MGEATSSLNSKPDYFVPLRFFSSQKILLPVLLKRTLELKILGNNHCAGIRKFCNDQRLWFKVLGFVMIPDHPYIQNKLEFTKLSLDSETFHKSLWKTSLWTTINALSWKLNSIEWWIISRWFGFESNFSRLRRLLLPIVDKLPIYRLVNHWLRQLENPSKLFKLYWPKFNGI